MLKVGITGGIGSGKTTVCHIFESIGVPVYYADERAKWLMNNDIVLIEGIKILFGDKAYLANGSLNRSHISDIAFKEKSVLDKLNALVHPAVATDAALWFSKQSASAYALEEAALLIESKSYLNLDKIIIVTAPLETRINRVVKRDGSSRENAIQRISNQMPEEEKRSFADFIINNDGEHLLLPQVVAIHQSLVAIVRGS
jgi:dephospho-CoA kinase